MLDQTFCFIKDFQTLIVGAIGFLGIILTINKNSVISRELRSDIRNHDKKAFRSAIYSELMTIKEIFTGRCADLENSGDGGILLPDSISTSVFDSLQSQIGILDVEEISQIIASYLLIKELPIRLKVLSVESNSTGTYEGYIFINSTYTKPAATLHENFIITIDEALNAIKL